jgi:hypothetical protein
MQGLADGLGVDQSADGDDRRRLVDPQLKRDARAEAGRDTHHTAHSHSSHFSPPTLTFLLRLAGGGLARGLAIIDAALGNCRSEKVRKGGRGQGREGDV